MRMMRLEVKMKMNMNMFVSKGGSLEWYAGGATLLLLGSAFFYSKYFNTKKKKNDVHVVPPTSNVLEQGNGKTRVEADDATYAQQQMCGICLEPQDYLKMFKNSTCSHTFCNDCTCKYATTKIQEKNNIITCPESNCNSTLDSNALRLIISKDILIKWDDVLCESLIPESDKFYCPFTSCSALLIKDDKRITKTKCPLCKRFLCASCRVPWHSSFTCNEFEKHSSKKADEMVIALAKKKNWKQCPNCNFFVEKRDGCSHITCRCKFHFCYKCGKAYASTFGCCKYH